MESLTLPLYIPSCVNENIGLIFNRKIESTRFTAYPLLGIHDKSQAVIIRLDTPTYHCHLLDCEFSTENLQSNHGMYLFSPVLLRLVLARLFILRPCSHPREQPSFF